MSEPDHLQKLELVSIRLAAECIQLAGDVPVPTWQSHFARMARVWTDLADPSSRVDAVIRAESRRHQQLLARRQDVSN
jgi:hypothetical protein